MSAPPNIPRTPSSNLSVSVVVPSYNHAQFVEKCLRSIMKQTIQPRELLVIDDGSSDDSVRVIERTLKDCTFTCDFVTRPNRGLSATLNEGLQRSRGEYFAYLDPTIYGCRSFCLRGLSCSRRSPVRCSVTATPIQSSTCGKNN